MEGGLSTNATDSSGSYVSQIELTNGVLIVTFGSGASAAINGLTVTLTPYETPGLDVVWRCGYANAPAGLSELGTSSGINVAVYVAPTIPPQYLPSSCRL